MSDRELPLAGVRVVEFGHIAAAPFASLLLADLGASVIKIEPPTGDGLRMWPPFTDTEGERLSLNFVALNRGKSCVSADLTDRQARQRVTELCMLADVVIENYRPGVLEKFGLGYRDIAERHRGVVYCSISGFGTSGPYRHKAAFDVVVQAMSGLMSVTGEPDGPPVKCGVPVADFVAGLYAALTVVSLLPQVRGGAGSIQVDCPMLDCLLGVSALQVSEYWGTGVAPARYGTAHSRNAPYEVFETADRPIAIAAGTPKLWQATCKALGIASLIDDDRFADQELRVANRSELVRLIEEVLTLRSCDAWVEILEESGIPCGPLNTFDEILRDPHVVNSGIMDTISLPSGAVTTALRYPVRISGRFSSKTLEAPDSCGDIIDDTLELWGKMK